MQQQQVDTIKCRLREARSSGTHGMYGQALDDVYAEFGNPAVNEALRQLNEEDGLEPNAPLPTT